MRPLLFLVGALAAALAVATMVPADLAPEVRWGVCAGAGLGAPALVVLWSWFELRARRRLRAFVPWLAGALVQAAVIAVPMLYGKQPDDAVAIVRGFVEPYPVATSSAASSGRAEAGEASHWRPRWVATFDESGLDVPTDVFVHRERAWVVVVGSQVDPSGDDAVFVRVFDLDDGAHRWTRRFVVDESGTPRVTRVDDAGRVHVDVALRGVLVLPDGRELGARVRTASSWSLRVTPDAVEATRIPSAVSVSIGGDRVRLGDGTFERVTADGTVRWSAPRGPMGYEISVIGDRVHAYAGPERDRPGEHVVLDAESGRVLARGPWFAGASPRIAMVPGPRDDFVWRAQLPRSRDALQRPDGSELVRTGDAETLVERVGPDLEPRWSRSFSNGAFDRSFDGVDVRPPPFVLASGAVLVAGSFEVPVDFGGGPMRPNGRADLFITELDADDGTTRMFQRLGGAGHEEVQAATLDDGELFVVGNFDDTLDFAREHAELAPREGDRFERSGGYVVRLVP